ncbi:MAG: tetratricopeptide repeat protein, partial [Thermoguttaceae bacterium]
AELAKIVEDFPKERGYQQQAQWDIANSFLSQARVVAAFSPTLARGQYVRTTRELRRVAEQYPKHPQIGTIPQMLWKISAELESRGYHKEAILVWNDLSINNPTHALAQQAAMKVAQTYQTRLKRPLLAVEADQELNFARGGNDQSLQNVIFQIGSTLKNEKRWVEALHILANFVDSFPRHRQAGQALTMVGQIHQANEAWEDAIAAYRRVINEFENGQFVQEAKWAIAECTINLSRWNEAMTAYRDYVTAYPGDGKVAEANRRIGVLKDLVRYQGLVDEKGQRKAFDAQYQIATIVHTQLANPVKAIIEYRKVVTNWPASHLADDALYAVGTTYLSLGETEKARDALLQVAQKYQASPLADDALFMVGKSFEDEAGRLASDTRGKSLERNTEVAQRRAYEQVQVRYRRQEKLRSDRISSLKKAGKGQAAALEAANWAGNRGQFNDANVKLFAQSAIQEVESLTATELADRQDKIIAALREAVEAYTSASKVAGADKADDALLKMATIYDQRLKDPDAAMATWLEIVRQFSGTNVAENASWRIAQYNERDKKYEEAIKAYKSFLRNYRSSSRAGAAQFAIAENYEHLGEWVNAMDSYTNYLNNFPNGPQVAKAKEQINWIKTYRL